MPSAVVLRQVSYKRRVISTAAAMVAFSLTVHLIDVVLQKAGWLRSVPVGCIRDRELTELKSQSRWELSGLESCNIAMVVCQIYSVGARTNYSEHFTDTDGLGGQQNNALHLCFPCH
jgi:hypothetical protein